MEKKLNILQNIFQNQISQVSYTKQCVVFGLPFMHTDYSKAVETISSLPYPIYSILHAFTKKPTFLQQKYFVQEAIFHVEADIKNDIYRRQALPSAWTHHHYVCCFKVSEIDKFNNELLNSETYPIFLTYIVDLESN